MTSLFALESFLVVSAFLFVIGMLIVLTKKNAIQIIMGIELIFNAAALNFVAFSYFRPHIEIALSGQVIAIFIIVVAAADACAALAIILSLFKVFKTTRIQSINRLRG